MNRSQAFDDDGWDVRARLVDDVWVERTPRRREVEAALRREVTLMGWLSPQLPLPVPVPEVVSDDPLRLRHRLVPGEPCAGTSSRQGGELGAFLAALHAVPVREALEHGALSAPDAAADRQRHRNDFASNVVPRLPVDLRAEGLRLLVRLTQADYAVAVTHADLGPSHVRVLDDALAGVIDWTDACLGDPALDLAWPLFGASADFAAGLRATYPVTDEVARRAHDWYLLGPWYEVTFGLMLEDPGYVDSGLAGAEARLRAAG